MQAHCDGGAWVGGDWVPIEECAARFLCRNQKTSAHCKPENCAACPRGRSRHSAAKPDGSYDVAIIGAGCIGACVARELAKTGCSVIVLEAADDVSQGATKGNSGIVHAGFDDKPGSVRARFCNKGCLMFPALDEELHFGFQRNGSLVVAMGPEDEKILEKLLKQGETNGVRNLRIIRQQELRQLEPEINPKATAALLAEDAGTLVPYEFCIAVMENAIDNGVELRLQREVTGIERAGDGSFVIQATHWETIPPKHMSIWKIIAASAAVVIGAVAGFFLATEKGLTPAQLGTLAFVVAAASFCFGSFVLPKQAYPKEKLHKFTPSKGTTLIGTAEIETIKASYIVNCAGTKSDQVAKLLGDSSFIINERLGDYVLLHKKEGRRVGRTLFPCPGPMGKGVLVQNTLWGNLILGPTARDTLRKDPVTGEYVVNEATRDETPESIITSILAKCRELVPSFDAKEVIHTFTGGRAKSSRGDWIVEQVPNCTRAVHAAGIDSPGLAGSPAIAQEVVRLLGVAGAPVKGKNPSFNPLRAPIVIPKKGFKDCFGVLLRMGPATDPAVNVVCKCEKVTEAEIIEACRRSIPIYSTQAIRKRTRAGMGHCQGDPKNYDCEARVAAIIAREQGVPVETISRRPWPASSLLPRRFITAADKEWVDKCSK
jgi:glycerol-3-phosphate dehydrogenase